MLGPAANSETMLKQFFHAWERRLASVTTDRVVRPFEWGLEWIGQNGDRPAPSGGEGPGVTPPEILGEWVSHVMADTEAFFTPPPTDEYELMAPSRDGDQILTFPSAFTTPQPRTTPSTAATFPRGILLCSRGPTPAAARPSSYCRSGTPVPAATSACAGCSRGTA